ncbi:hypothetical protein [Aquamicrobium defluvii]|uniref:Lipoprotein n=1 Tax=Aquamicrobium defluvii TaxID=69279 RepID=A0A011VNT0_9HYPH|nr:hypothetical protein [Aquamicrobium defluvii]EXL10025.1 hypothetical protein BG36_07615 [Aquamicrobium defluvii]EZQ16799.1 hypothetical protein CF98_37175 [Halopseudomonas bauzanensis]TDR36342.1 hypothetical protein DES43_1056 [Aquamicrobium defluvii]
MRRSCAVLIITALATTAMAGCSSHRVDPAAYQSASCVDLDTSIGMNSREISATAVRRGKVDSWEPPFWLAGARRGAEAVKNRQTAKIDRLQQQGTAMTAERARRC